MRTCRDAEGSGPHVPIIHQHLSPTPLLTSSTCTQAAAAVWHYAFIFFTTTTNSTAADVSVGILNTVTHLSDVSRAQVHNAAQQCDGESSS
jgi:hypothetical protein